MTYSDLGLDPLDELPPAPDLMLLNTPPVARLLHRPDALFQVFQIGFQQRQRALQLFPRLKDRRRGGR